VVEVCFRLSNRDRTTPALNWDAWLHMRQCHGTTPVMRYNKLNFVNSTTSHVISSSYDPTQETWTGVRVGSLRSAATVACSSRLSTPHTSRRRETVTSTAKTNETSRHPSVIQLVRVNTSYRVNVQCVVHLQVVSHARTVKLNLSTLPIHIRRRPFVNTSSRLRVLDPRLVHNASSCPPPACRSPACQPVLPVMLHVNPRRPIVRISYSRAVEQ